MGYRSIFFSRFMLEIGRSAYGLQVQYSSADTCWRMRMLGGSEVCLWATD